MCIRYSNKKYYDFNNYRTVRKVVQGMMDNLDIHMISEMCIRDRCYLDRVDMENLGDEWQYLLQAYLSGVFGVDKEFHHLIHQCFTDLLTQMESMHPQYGNRVIDKTMVYSNSYIHVTDYEFETLRRHCTEYEELKNLLSQAEKNEVLAMHFRKVW